MNRNGTTPNEHKDNFFGDVRFITALDLMVDAGYISKTTDILDLVKHVSGITEVDIEVIKSSPLESLVSSSKVEMSGEAFHSARKYSLKQFERDNPVPALIATFESLNPFSETDPRYAAGFLSELCDLIDSRHLTTPAMAQLHQSISSSALGTVLPRLYNEYMMALSSQKGDMKSISDINAGYRLILSGLLRHMRTSIIEAAQLSQDSFDIYLRSNKLQNALIPNGRQAKKAYK